MEMRNGTDGSSFSVGVTTPMQPPDIDYYTNFADLTVIGSAAADIDSK